MTGIDDGVASPVSNDSQVFYFEILRLEIWNRAYKGQKPKTPVNKNAIEITTMVGPKTHPLALMKRSTIPIINRRTRSKFPIFFFIKIFYSRSSIPNTTSMIVVMNRSD